MVGPISSLLTSPWLPLYVYAVLRRGPPCYLYRRGTRLAAIPPRLQGFTSLLASPFGADAVRLPAASALATLNDMLLKVRACRAHGGHAAEWRPRSVGTAGGGGALSAAGSAGGK